MAFFAAPDGAAADLINCQHRNLIGPSWDINRVQINTHSVIYLWVSVNPLFEIFPADNVLH